MISPCICQGFVWGKQIAGSEGAILSVPFRHVWPTLVNDKLTKTIILDLKLQVLCVRAGSQVLPLLVFRVVPVG